MELLPLVLSSSICRNIIWWKVWLELSNEGYWVKCVVSNNYVLIFTVPIDRLEYLQDPIIALDSVSTFKSRCALFKHISSQCCLTQFLLKDRHFESCTIQSFNLCFILFEEQVFLFWCCLSILAVIKLPIFCEDQFLFEIKTKSVLFLQKCFKYNCILRLRWAKERISLISTCQNERLRTFSENIRFLL